MKKNLNGRSIKKSQYWLANYQSFYDFQRIYIKWFRNVSSPDNGFHCLSTAVFQNYPSIKTYKRYISILSMKKTKRAFDPVKRMRNRTEVMITSLIYQKT